MEINSFTGDKQESLKSENLRADSVPDENRTDGSDFGGWKIFNIILAVFLISLVSASTIFSRSLYLTKSIPRNLVFFAGFAIISIFLLKFITNKKGISYSVFRNPIACSVAVFNLALILSVVFSKDPWISFWGSFLRQTGYIVLMPATLCAFLMMLVLDTEKKVERLVRLIVILGTVNALYGLMQAVGFDILKISGEIQKGPYNIRPSGFTGNPDFFAVMVIFSFFPALSMALASRIKKQSFYFQLWVVVAAIQGAAIIASMTRSSWFALFAGLVVWIFIVWKKISGGGAKKFLKVFSVVFIFVAIVFAAIFIFVPKYSSFASEKFKSIFTFSEKYYYTKEVIPLGRPYLWRDTAALCKDCIAGGRITGVGPENFYRYFLPYKSLKLAQVTLNMFYDNPHNNYLSVLATGGLPGFAAYLFIFAAVFITGFKFLRKSFDKEKICLMAGLVSALAGYAVNMLGIFDILPMLILFYTFAGIVAASNYLLLKSGPAAQSDIPANFAVRRRIFIIPVLVCSAVLIFCVAGIVNYIFLWRADSHYKRAVKNLETLKGKENPALLENAVNELEKSCGIYPRESFYCIELIRVLGMKAGIVLKSDAKQADILYMKSMYMTRKCAKFAWSPATLYMTCGINSYRMGYLDNAITSFEEALKWDRWNTLSHTTLGTFYYLKYLVVKDDLYIRKAFEHSYATVMILKFFPHRDLIAFNTSLQMGIALYEKTGEKDLLNVLSSILAVYVRVADKSADSQNLIMRTAKLMDGSSFANFAAAAKLFYEFRCGKKSADETLREIRCLKQDNNMEVRKYIEVLNSSLNTGGK